MPTKQEALDAADAAIAAAKVSLLAVVDGALNTAIRQRVAAEALPDDHNLPYNPDLNIEFENALDVDMTIQSVDGAGNVVGQALTVEPGGTGQLYRLLATRITSTYGETTYWTQQVYDYVVVSWDSLEESYDLSTD